MRYSVYIDYDRIEGGPENFIEFFPEIVKPFKLCLEKSASGSMQQYFYRILWGTVEFTNNPFLYNKTLNNAYKLFDFIYNLNFSQKVYIRYVTENNTIDGYFGRNDCDFDYDRKTIKVEPAVIDKYTTILENSKNKVNFENWEYTNSKVTVEITNENLKTIQDWPYPAITGNGFPITPRNRIKEKDFEAQDELLLYFDGEAPKDELFSDLYYRFEGTHRVLDSPIIAYSSFTLDDRIAILGQEGTPELIDEYGDYELSLFRVYKGTRIGGLSGKRWRQLYCQTQFTRDETIKIDVVDEDTNNEYGFEPPIGTGWHMRHTRIKNGQNAHLWTRKPFNGAYSDNWELQPEVVNDSLSEFDWNWYKYLETKLIYDDSNRDFSLESTINLRDFIEHIIRNSNDALSDIEFKSTFFFNDLEDDLEMLNGTNGFNYVTGSKNYLNNIKLFFTSILKELDADEVSNLPEFTIVSVLTELNKIFAEKLIWFIDSYGYFRIEHQRYIDLVKLAINVKDNQLLNFTSQWSYDKTLMFERFEYKQINAGYKDFTNNIVIFDKIISNNRNKDLKYESSTSIFTTDAKYCILNPNDISNGVVLIATNNDNKVLNKVGLISNTLETNGYLALSNILFDFGRYEGVWHSGIMNNIPVNFTTTQRNKLGVKLSIDAIKISMFYITQLGYGMIDSGTLDFENETISIVLRYRYNSSVNGDMFVLAFQKSTDFVGANDAWADIDNYIK